MVNGLHLYSAFIQSALQFMPLIHPFTHTFTHQRRLAAMQGTNQLVRSNWGLGVSLRDTSTQPRVGSNRQPSDCQTTALPPEPHRPHHMWLGDEGRVDTAYAKSEVCRFYPTGPHPAPEKGPPQAGASPDGLYIGRTATCCLLALRYVIKKQKKKPNTCEAISVHTMI